jgi:hypothetical protein
MTNNMLDAIMTTVSMVRGAYTWSEALSYAEVTYNLDEFEADDLRVHARNQYNRLEAQTNGK